MAKPKRLPDQAQSLERAQVLHPALSMFHFIASDPMPDELRITRRTVAARRVFACRIDERGLASRLVWSAAVFGERDRAFGAGAHQPVQPGAPPDRHACELAPLLTPRRLVTRSGPWRPSNGVWLREGREAEDEAAVGSAESSGRRTGETS
jgi:hypothetical protein